VNDEIMFRFGGDLNPLKAAANQAKQIGGDIKKSFGDVGRQIAGYFSAGAMIAGLQRVFSKVEEIKRASESLGVSNSFIQDIRNVGEDAGISGQKIEAALGKFLKGLPEGADVEASFFALADRLSEIEDPAERARVAVDAFGKSGVQMISIMGQGSAAVKELAAQFSKLSDEEIKKLDDAKDTIDRTFNNITIGAGKAISAIGDLFGKLGEMSQGDWDSQAKGKAIAEMAEQRKRIDAEEELKAAKEAAANVPEVDPEKQRAAMDRVVKAQEQLAELKKKHANEDEVIGSKIVRTEDRIAHLKQVIAESEERGKTDAEFAAQAAEAKVEMANEELKLKGQIAERDKSIAEKEKEQAETKKKLLADRLQLEEKLQQTQASRSDAQRDRLRPSLEEFADEGRRNIHRGSGWRRGGPTGTQRDAMEIERAEREAKLGYLNGNEDYAKRMQNYAERIRASNPNFKKSDSDLYASMDAQLKEVNKALTDNGIKIKEITA
jgi:hypothetical protein